MGNVRLRRRDPRTRLTREGYVFTASIPDVEDEDVEVAIAGDELWIMGTRSGKRTVIRTIEVPRDIDVEHAHAETRHGVVRTVVPRLDHPRPHNIQGGPPWFGWSKWVT